MVVSRIYFLLLILASRNYCYDFPINAGQIYFGYSSVVASYYDPEQLHTLAIDKIDGTIYVGGTNKLLQIEEDLKVDGVKEKSVGPRLDHPDCPARGECKPADGSPKLTNNVNKLLVIDYESSQVIACGTLDQGSCLIFELGNVQNITREVEEAVTVNNGSLSSVAFLAPAPVGYSESQLLYVGSQYSGNSIYRQEVPAIASRYLDEYLSIPSEIASSSRMTLNSFFRDSYPITYVHGFTSGKFSYFITRQKKDTSPNSPFISRLVRICLDDLSYSSYTEIDLICQSNGKFYNLVQDASVSTAGVDFSASMGIQVTDDVLYGIFSSSLSSKGDLASEESALCIYSLPHINEIFTRNLKKCFAGEGDIGLDFILPSRPCIPLPSIDIDDEFCGMDVNTPLSGRIPAESEAILTYPIAVTSVASFAQGPKTIVYLGTAHGNLKTVQLESTTSTREDFDIVVDSGSPIKDIQFAKDKDHLYLLSDNRVSKVKITPCVIYSYCEECLGVKDLHCGWCSSEQSCYTQEECPDGIKYPQYWGGRNSNQCRKPYIYAVYPYAIPWNTVTGLSLSFNPLPPAGGQYECLFKFFNRTIATPIKRINYLLRCNSPKIETLPEITDEEYFSAELWLREKDGPEITPTTIKFYDCSRHSSCAKCTSSNFACSWCTNRNICTNDYDEQCTNDTTVKGLNMYGSLPIYGSSSCSRISNVEGHEIIVPSGTTKSIKVQVHSLYQSIVDSSFKCKFRNGDTSITVEAQLIEDVIHCEEAEFIALSSTTVYTVDVLWGESIRLDNPENVKVTAYDCNLSATNCGHCSLLPEEYQCGWCKTNKKCELATESSKPMMKETTCPDVRILDFEPQSGPLEGGTDITIRGINLGLKFEDISDGIIVAGVKCEPFKESYVPSEEIKCRIGEPDDPRSGSIVVRVNNIYEGESSSNYVFVDPQISDISPTSGPISGATRIFISGRHLDAGSRVNASLGDQPCEILSRNSTVISCTTGSATRIGEEKLTMNFDYGVRDLATVQFNYVEDPIITNVMTGGDGSRILRPGLRIIPSGGTFITVEGKGFNLIEDPKIYAVYENQEFNNICQVKSDTRMECRSPIIPVPVSKFPPGQDFIELDYGFLMGNVDGVKSLSKRNPSVFNPLKLFKDPVFNPLPNDGVKLINFKYLLLDGESIDSVLDISDYLIQIGNRYCSVTSFSSSQLSCLVPLDQPMPIHEGNVLPEIIVRVGQTLKYEIGFAKYVNF